jgi:hypothetical protein
MESSAEFRRMCVAGANARVKLRAVVTTTMAAILPDPRSRSGFAS